MSELDYTPFMREAIALAQQGRWKTCPNPMVGAVLVRDGQVVARGWHHAFGKAHAEVDCLNDAAARGVDPAQ
ncbi:riboflavin biosynthesis protein RibD, partial [Desulfovibrio sp. 1214_IL3152]